MSSYETCLRKEIKWHQKLAVEFLFDMCLVNTHIIHQKLTGKRMRIKKFREKNAAELLGPWEESAEQAKKETYVLKTKTNEQGEKLKIKCKRCYENFVKKVKEEVLKIKLKTSLFIVTPVFKNFSFVYLALL